MASFVKITRVEISSTSPSIELTSGGAWADYTDLLLILSARSDRAAVGDFLGVVINGDSTSSNYEQRTLEGNGTSAQSETRTNKYELAFVGGDSTTSNTFSSSRIYFANINSDSHKAISSDSAIENNGSVGSQLRVAGLYKSSSAITSIELIPSVGNFKQYTSATLYGIKKYNTPSAPKATGGIISFDSLNNNWVHTFTASGTFTPTENLTAEYLVIAGGGGGGGGDNGYSAGGGGAGGYRSSVMGESSGGGASAESTLNLTASTGYTVTIGAGGAKGVGTSGGASTSGSNGGNSSFSTIIATGGGGGGAADQQNSPSAGLSGGSGGGGGTGPTSGASGGSGTANEGYDGGSAQVSGYIYAGGGGGAAAAGTDGTSTIAGDGGDGVQSSITGVAIYRAGGGGASTFNGTLAAGGSGGGGVGASVSPAINATPGLPGTGGGGGGGGDQTNTGRDSAAGGSGVVIVRYAA